MSMGLGSRGLGSRGLWFRVVRDTEISNTVSFQKPGVLERIRGFKRFSRARARTTKGLGWFRALPTDIPKKERKQS